MAFENNPCHKIIRLASKKKISVFTKFRMIKMIVGKSLRHLRKLVLTEAIVQKHLERSTLSLKDVCWITGIESSFFRWENFCRWSCLQQTEWSDRNVWEWCLWTQKNVSNQASSVNYDVWLRSIERGESAFDLVSTGLQANIYHLQRSFGDESFPVCQKDH